MTESIDTHRIRRSVPEAVGTRHRGRPRRLRLEHAEVILETDGCDAHHGRIAFEDDRDRDQRLLAAGYVVMRVTWRQLTQQPEKVIARLAALLATRDAVRD